MNLFLLISILLLAVTPSLCYYCTSTCMSNFQHELHKITGTKETSPMTAPFHMIIALNDDNKSTHRQIRHLCSKVKSWETCVRSCSRDSSQAILLSSMDQWKKFCAVMRKTNKVTNEYLNCERDHQQKISEHCAISMPTTFSVTVFCKYIETFRKCTDRFVHQCSDDALILKNEIDEAIQNSFRKLMKFATNKIRLPHRCNIWQRNHHHTKKIRGEVLLEPDISTTTTAKPTTIIISHTIPENTAHEVQITRFEELSSCNCNQDQCSQQCPPISLPAPSRAVKLMENEKNYANTEEPIYYMNSYHFPFYYSSVLFLFIYYFK